MPTWESKIWGETPIFFLKKKKKKFSNFPFCLLILYPVFLLCPTQSSVTKESSPVAVAEQESEEVIDIDLNDPEVEKAALKIQAGFKGFRKAKKATTQVWASQRFPSRCYPLGVFYVTWNCLISITAACTCINFQDM